MSGIPEDPREVIESALTYEAEGYRILCDARESAIKPLSKATFEFLASEEVKHMEAIRQYAESLAQTGEFDTATLSPVSLPEAGAEIKGIFERFKAEFEELAGRLDERLEVYEVAMDMERRGYEFYRNAAHQSTDETARKLYGFLTEEESKHFQMLQDTYTFIRQPDAVMAVEERWMQI